MREQKREQERERERERERDRVIRRRKIEKYNGYVHVTILYAFALGMNVALRINACFALLVPASEKKVDAIQTHPHPIEGSNNV